MLSRLESGALQQSFLSWVKEIAARSCADIIAIDGKAARRSFKTKERKNLLHMVSAWSCNNGLVLGQRKVADKSNEIMAIPLLPDLLEPKGAMVTIDAMGSQKDIAAKIASKKGHYMLALKGN